MQWASGMPRTALLLILFLAASVGCGGDSPDSLPPPKNLPDLSAGKVNPAPQRVAPGEQEPAPVSSSLSSADLNETPVVAERPAVEAAVPAEVPFSTGFLRGPEFIAGPNENAPLSAVIEFETADPVHAQAEITGPEREWVISGGDGPSRAHRIVLVGFGFEREYRVRLRLFDAARAHSFVAAEETFTTPAAPKDFPPIEASVSDPGRMEPGVTLFNAMQWQADKANEARGWMIAVDSAGEVVWYCQTDHPVSELRQLRNGNMIYLRSHRSKPLTAAIEVDLLGNVVNQWYAAGISSEVPEGAIPVDVDTFHHEIYELKSGNLLAISTEVRKLERFPTSATEPSTLGPAYVVGDVLVEFQRDGTIVKEWKLHDILDTNRIGYGSLSHFWDTRIYKGYEGGTRDWSHANGVVCDENEEWMLVSVRHQDAVVKIHRQSGEIGWILGNPTGWRLKWRKLVLAPRGRVDWPYHQHSPDFTPQGTILMYDNGNYRARPFRRPRAGHETNSRVVEFAVDEEAMTVRQVWEYKGILREDKFFSPLFGDADWLPETGNVLITDGGRMEDAQGRPTNEIPGRHQWARIVEVTHTERPEKVFELVLDSGAKSNTGWSIYRGERLPSLVPVIRTKTTASSPGGIPGE